MSFGGREEEEVMGYENSVLQYTVEIFEFLCALHNGTLNLGEPRSWLFPVISVLYREISYSVAHVVCRFAT